MSSLVFAHGKFWHLTLGECGSNTKNLCLAIAMSPGMDVEEQLMDTAPYPSYAPIRNSDIGRSGLTLTRLEYRIGVLEYRVQQLQEKLEDTVSFWDWWYHHWTPLFRLLRWMFSAFTHSDRAED